MNYFDYQEQHFIVHYNINPVQILKFTKTLLLDSIDSLDCIQQLNLGNFLGNVPGE